MGHPRDIEQVVDQPGGVSDLPVDDLHGAPGDLLGAVGRAQDVHGGAQGGQRVSQLVAQDGEEGVTPRHPQLQLLGGELLFGDVLQHGEHVYLLGAGRTTEVEMLTVRSSPSARVIRHLSARRLSPRRMRSMRARARARRSGSG